MSFSSLPFTPPAGQQPMLAGNAKASLQFARLLDALLILDAEGSSNVADLATRVGLPVARLRELISSYMVAGAEALGSDAPFNLSWGTDEGVLGTSEEYDNVQADVIHLSGHKTGEWLVGELGRRPVMVKDVARALLAAKVVLEAKSLPPGQELTLRQLVDKLSAAMRASVDTPAEATAATLQTAVRERRRVAFRYLHPWTGETTQCEVEPYDIRRRRERLVLDTNLGTYDVTGVSQLEVGPESDAFTRPELPPRDERTPVVEVVLSVEAYSSQEDWLLGGWRGKVTGPLGDGRVGVRVELDGDPADPGVVERLGVLLLQLGPSCRVEEPASLRHAARSVGERLLARH